MSRRGGESAPQATEGRGSRPAVAAAIGLAPAIDWEAFYADAPTGYDAPPDDRALVDRSSGRGASRYGEITVAAARCLLRWLAPRPSDTFFDLGSGIGRLVVQAACTTEVGRAVGVELSPYRDGAARLVVERLLAALPEAARTALRERLEFRREDLRTTDLAGATIVWTGSTCFPESLLLALAEHVALAARGLRVLLTTRPLPAACRAFRERGRVDLDMSWAKRVAVHAYELR